MAEGVWFIRIVDGIKHGFPLRYIEWIMGVGALVWSMKWLLDPADNFQSVSGAWDGLRFWFHSDTLFSGSMSFVALMRLTALTVNGTFRETVYARYSPIVRGITAMLCGIAWLFILLSTAASGTQGAVTYWMPVAIEFLTAWFVITESADVLRDWRHGNSRRHGT